MEERYFGEKTPKLGFGLMRLPRIEGTNTIDVEQTSKMIDMFLEAGLTYFDTAFVYEGSEEATRKALVERHPRDSYTLATKLNAGYSGCKNAEDDKKKSWRSVLKEPAQDILTTIFCTLLERAILASTTSMVSGIL